MDKLVYRYANLKIEASIYDKFRKICIDENVKYYKKINQLIEKCVIENEPKDIDEVKKQEL